jgi:hypothetical protein
MNTFIVYLMIAFPLLLIFVVHLSYCKRRQQRTNHGLTGMCHDTGGSMCGCCSAKLMMVEPKKKPPLSPLAPADPQASSCPKSAD